ncbi:FAD-dependent oxidoreductase [Silicimonas algicola]|uniref:Glycine/D-amino acid oxidase-like deaminating enzyme n=1 Tax=Silicimonas algicola TaxID=1826607 RepID=A0A316G3C7_9RHOB|nr:FAD-dependent oxidoreductase [Silicimonas algicola]AZQ67026.1 FAD-dependent oxidoreductase [Silicimonas algicola]PWK55454.1 glycine/D-amino acid oxidase-like deaminating enzyme [Silicimonas algicola]
MKIAIVGRGLIGSAAARHLARAGHDVTLIGPDEPPRFEDHRGVFGSHYDEGRITRVNDRRPFFARVSHASIARYAEIEAQSGIPFFTASGSLVAGGPDYMEAVAKGREGLSFAFDDLSPDALKSRFPCLAFPAGFSGVYEPKAGHISPRRLVAAQTEAARRAGARIIAQEAVSVGDGRVRTADTSHSADRVIVAAGGWTDAVLGRAAVLEVYARTVAFHEIGPAEDERLRDMPSFVYDSPDSIYVLPPIRYPDGKVWLKLGGDPEDVLLPDQDAVGAWFRNGGSVEIGHHLTDTIRRLLPGLAFESRHIAPCVTTWTDTRVLEIRRLSPRLIVAAGGNGSGAKCSDELGRMAAALTTETAEETTP